MHESAGRFRLSRVRLARSETHLVIRILREWREGRGLGSDRQALHAGVFADHTVTELSAWSDYDLEMVGRLTHPMAYDGDRTAIFP